jgi:hypothetical protein
MSQVTTEPEVAAELFLFEPDQDESDPDELGRDGQPSG